MSKAVSAFNPANPLDGTEQVGLVQGGGNKRTTVAELWGKVSTVAALPAAGIVGRRAFVTNANSTVFNSVVAGGGANKVPVFDDGAAWRIG